MGGNLGGRIARAPLRSGWARSRSIPVEPSEPIILATRPVPLARWDRPLWLALTGVLLLIAAWEASIVLPPALTRGIDVTWGLDLRPYLAHADRWLAGDGFYLSAQLAGPYSVEALTGNVYPPVLLYLLVPFTLGLPWVLWWTIPLAITAVAVAAARPAPWQWPILALILVYPRTWTVIVLGNPAMWALAALAAGMVWKWPLVGVALKATFAPLALLGIRDRRWWLALAVAVALALPFGGMWFDFATAVLNAQTDRGIEYTLGEWPIAIALTIGLWRTISARASRASG